MISIFIEPPTAAAHRLAMVNPMTSTMTARSVTVRPHHNRLPKPHDDFWTQLVFETLNLEDEPLRITTVVNEVAAWGGYATRSEREGKKIELFKLIGKLVRIGRLQRVGRRYVTIPANDDKYQAYLAQAAAAVELPEPCV